MYQLAISRDFIARHFLIGGDWGAENEEHSHHYRAEIIIEGRALDHHGYLIDIVALEHVLQSIIALYAEKVLNEQPTFAGLNPSIEHFSRIIWQHLNEGLARSSHKMTVRLWENERDWAAFSADVSG
jgi:6-pyruvoyltetrahydropterin/6-carboxytetrahydropterin synthase